MSASIAATQGGHNYAIAIEEASHLRCTRMLIDIP